MSERCFVLVDFTHMNSAGCLSLYEAGDTYTMPRAIAHASVKRGRSHEQDPRIGRRRVSSNHLRS
jgi:hypothetical protein